MEANKKLLWLGAFAYAFVLLLFLSPDSYLYDVFGRCDSAWFFMCGKAWMNGMVPYVDFADSKGPLLWLIYGVGYLFSPRSFIGVFWLSVVAYAVTLVLAYKLTRLFAGGRVAVGVLALLPIALLYKRVHYEVRAEDFCYPLSMACLYLSFLVAKEKGRRLFWPAFGIGACLMACLLIKWSIAAMLSGTAFVVLVFSLKRGDCKGILGGLLGLCAVAVPFLVYFLWQGNFSAFVQEYFLNTYTTVSHKPLYMVALENVGPRRLCAFLAFVGGFALSCRRYKLSWWMIVIPLPLMLLAVTPGYFYYYSITMPFTVVPCILAVDMVLQRVSVGRKLFGMGCALVVVVGVAYNFQPLHRRLLRFKKSALRQAYYAMEERMARVENPRVTIYPMDHGTGIVAHALPANKYWAWQNGGTPAMRQEREEALRQRKADFIIVKRASHTDETWLSEEKLAKNGYAFCGITVDQDGLIDLYVYSRKD